MAGFNIFKYANRILWIVILCILCACKNNSTQPDTISKEVPHEERWGIYALDPASETVKLIFTSSRDINFLHLNHKGDQFVFSRLMDGDEDKDEEICVVDSDGTGFRRLTENQVRDLYPVWSPDDTEILFLSFPGSTLDIYKMNADGSNRRMFFDSGFHDADIDWQAETIVFTSRSKIWTINQDGTNPASVTDPPRRGEWGNAVLPFGDYDPRLSPDGTVVVFERMEADSTVHGNYNLFSINTDGTNENRLTDNGYTQGIAAWSHSGEELVYMVSAIGDQGVYDLYIMNTDGSNNHNITPEYFPINFLCESPQFSLNDSTIYFVGEWWE